MRKDVAKKWVKALRSGKYNQGQGCLKQTNRNNKTYHCCLGVLCELYNDEMRKKKKKMLTETVKDGIHKFNRMDELLPKVVQNWAGLGSSRGDFESIANSPTTHFYNGLADMNDFGSDFKTIANIIENNPDNI